jgi:uncharacterized Ntn-hydrolase superfamily protein
MIESLAQTFESASDLRSILQTFLETPGELRSFQEAAINVAAEYDREGQGPQFDSIVDDLLGTDR